LYGVNDASHNPEGPDVRWMSLPDCDAESFPQVFDLCASVETRLDSLLEPFERVAKERARRAQPFPGAGHSKENLEFFCG
jgi:hypothetical protein